MNESSYLEGKKGRYKMGKEEEEKNNNIFLPFLLSIDLRFDLSYLFDKMVY